MITNVTKNTISPELPKVTSKEQLHVYVPIATESVKGIASFNEEHFQVIDGKVKLKKEYLKLLDAYLEEAEDIISNAVLKRGPNGEFLEAQEIYGNLYVTGFLSAAEKLLTNELTVNRSASIGGNLVAEGTVSGKNITEMQAKLSDAVLKNPQGGSTQTVNGLLRANQMQTVGYLNVGSNLNVNRDATIGGNLYVKGTTYTVEQQTVIAKDNIIVTNSVNGATFTASGLVINKGNDKSYGILYMPEGDAVYIGEGTLTVTKDKDGNVTDMEFEYDEGQALPLAARSEFGEAEDGFVPVWDSELNAFVPGNFKGQENEAGLIEQFGIEHPTLDESNEKYHPHFIATVGTVKDVLGDISAALDELHAYAQSIYGGNG